ncbi:MAG: SRPBCC domain-containing protein [Rubrivivax sp.]|nr:SRPBCC domain-containing protein [Rubrivivax sp.]
MQYSAFWRAFIPWQRSGLATLALLAWALVGTLPAHAQERALNKEVLVAAPQAAVWQAWTSRDGIVSFFAPDAVVDARVGGAFHIHFDPGAPPGLKGADDSRFLALQAPRMLSFDWNAPPSLPEARAQRTFVVVRLHAVDSQTTRVTLHHTGWGDGGEWDRAYAYFDRVWGAVLGNLKKRFDSGPQDWTAWLGQLEAARQRARTAATAASAASAPSR